MWWKLKFSFVNHKIKPFSYAWYVWVAGLMLCKSGWYIWWGLFRWKINFMTLKWMTEIGYKKFIFTLLSQALNSPWDASTLDLRNLHLNSERELQCHFTDKKRNLWGEESWMRVGIYYVKCDNLRLDVFKKKTLVMFVFGDKF